MNKITTILQLWKRPSYFNEQLEAIRGQSVKSDKIVCVQNEDVSGEEFNFPEDVNIIRSKENKKFHFRFAVGLTEDTEYLAFFDDDTIPSKEWYKNCIETIEKHDCICVSNARDVLPDGRQTCPAGWGVPNDKEVKCWFGGHAWFFKKKNLKYMWYDDVYEYTNGEDVMLSANAWLYAKIPTYCPPHPINNKDLWGSLKGKELGSDKVASWITNPTHFSERVKLINYYLERGWKPI